MKCMNCGIDLVDKTKFCPRCGEINNQPDYKEEDTRIAVEEQNVYENANLSDNKEIPEQTNGINDVLKKINQETSFNSRKPIEQIDLTARRRKRLIFTGIILMVIIIVVITIYLFGNKDKKENDKKDEDRNITDYSEVMSNYGNIVETKVSLYIAKNGEIPTIDEIINNIAYQNYNIVCKTIEFYSTGKIFLSECNINNSTEKYSYGIYIENDENISNDEEEGLIYIKRDLEYDSINASKYFNDEFYELIYIYECAEKSCDVLDYFDEKILIKDKNVKIFNYKTKKVEKEIDLSKYKYEYIQFAYYNDKIYGLIISNENYKYAFYSLDKNKLMTGFDYDEIDFYNSPTLTKGYLFANKTILYDDENDKYIYDYVKIDMDTGKVTATKRLETTSDWDDRYYIRGNENSIYIVLGGYFTDNYKIYDENFKELFKGKSFKDFNVLKNGNVVLVNENNTYSIYNYSETNLFTSKEYKSIPVLTEEYAGVVDNDDYVKIVDYEDNVKAVFEKFNSKTMFFHSMISGYYKNGIYLVIEEENAKNGMNCKEYYWQPNTNKKGVEELEYCDGYAKPILYLYPKFTTLVTVTFANISALTTTYPKFIDKWTVIANKNSDLYDLKGNYYYALYWEENSNHRVSFNEGFYVTKDNAIDFLEEKLTIIGFNAKERNEFIMYWLPILEKNGQSLVYFELTEEREFYNKLIINPIPDSLLRVAIHVKKVNSYTKIKEQKLKTFNRKGFAAIEWGGVLY